MTDTGNTLLLEAYVCFVMLRNGIDFAIKRYLSF